jgi:fanconi-associated nuclease 1
MDLLARADVEFEVPRRDESVGMEIEMISARETTNFEISMCQKNLPIRLATHPTLNTVGSYEVLLHRLEIHKIRSEAESHKSYSTPSLDQADYEFHYPYYRRNFITVLDQVLKRDPHLLIETEFSILRNLLELPDDAQKLYIRLIQRSTEWMTVHKLRYEDIKDLSGCIQTLRKDGLLNFESNPNHQLYELLSKSDIKHIFGKVLPTTFRVSKKIEFIEENLRRISNQLTLDGKPLASIIQEKLRDKLRNYFRLNSDHLRLMRRLLRLFFMTHEPDEAGFSELYLIGIEERKYPAYRVWRTTHPFQDRSSYLEFEESLDLEILLQNSIMNHQWSDAVETIEKLEIFASRLSPIDPSKFAESLFLLRYTSFWVITRAKSAAVGVWERLRSHEKAVQYLRDLLSQEIVCCNSRGYWYDRLSVNLASHLKDTPSAIEACHQGISDPHVRAARRYALKNRLHRLSKLPKPQEMSEDHFEILSCPARTLKAKRLDVTAPGSRALYDMGTAEPLNVEAVALQYYLDSEDWTTGFHTEGGILQMLFTLVFWDILFAEYPDVFQTPYQIAPLDLSEECFYRSRRDLIELRLKLIAQDRPSLLTLLSECYTNHRGISAIGVQWDVFSLETLLEVVSCISARSLAGICRLFAEDFRHRTSGLPDLVLYNLKSHSVKFVEVKSEHDRLSDKQRIWIHELVSLGLAVEVLHVLNT